MYSIVISTYGTPQFLKECLDSLPDVPVIIGVDGCLETKRYILDNWDYFSKYKVFWFPDNHGPYIVKNNLIKEVQTEYTLFFDSDDILTQTKFKLSKDIHRLTFQIFDSNGLGKKE